MIIFFLKSDQTWQSCRSAWGLTTKYFWTLINEPTSTAAYRAQFQTPRVESWYICNFWNLFQFQISGPNMAIHVIWILKVALLLTCTGVYDLVAKGQIGPVQQSYFPHKCKLSWSCREGWISHTGTCTSHPKCPAGGSFMIHTYPYMFFQLTKYFFNRVSC